jgi:hypothetical protein
MAKPKKILLTISNKSWKKIETIAKKMDIQFQKLLKQMIEIYLDEFIRKIRVESIRNRSIEEKHQFIDKMCGYFRNEKVSLTQALLEERENEFRREEQKIHIR